MTKLRSARGALFGSIVALLLCFTMLLGATFAWFTDSVTSGGNIIQTGTLDVSLEHADSVLGVDDVSWIDASTGPIFNYDNWEAGYTVVKYVKIENEGSLDLKFVLNIVPNNEAEEVNLADVIEVYMVSGAVEIDRAALDPESEAYVGTLTALMNETDGAAHGVLYADDADKAGNVYEIYTIALKMSTSAGDEYMGKSVGGGFSIQLLATQLASEEDSFDGAYDEDAEYPVIPTVDKWDGTADTTWYNEADTEFILTTAEQFAGLAELVGTTDQFEGKTIILDTDVDLTLEDGVVSAFGSSFAPIGSTGERDGSNRLITESFKGTFDGNGHTISNLYQSGWDFGYEWQKYGSIGLFSELEGATVKNVVLEGFTCQVEGGDVAFIAGSATGDCVFENIEIKNGSIGTYNNGIGSIIGWSGAGSYTFKDITIGEDVVIGGLWGSFDSSVGGIVGQGEAGATYNFENVNVACRLDAYNDVTASYQYYLYRMTGMLIGRLAETTTIDGSNYPDMSKYNITCKDVTVTYGDWMNYHYCYGFNGDRYTRVESGFTYGGLDITAEDHDATCTDHMLCLPFDGLFGGDQYGVRPITQYEGVTVNYPDSYNPGN